MRRRVPQLGFPIIQPNCLRSGESPQSAPKRGSSVSAGQAGSTALRSVTKGEAGTRTNFAPADTALALEMRSLIVCSTPAKHP